MTTTPKQYSRKFKARVALEAIRGERTLNQLASQFPVHPVQSGHWRKTVIEQLGELFSDGGQRKQRDGELEKEALLEEIGWLKMELDWLKKKLVCWTEDRRLLVEAEQPWLSVGRQCELLGVSRASLYYQPVGEREENLLLLRLLEEQYTRTPF